MVSRGARPQLAEPKFFCMIRTLSKTCALLAVSGLVAGLAIAGTPQGNGNRERPRRTNPIELKVGEGNILLPIDSRSLFKTVSGPTTFNPSDKGRMRLPASGPELYGSVVNSDATIGLYKLPTSSTAKMTMVIPDVKAQSALLINGQYYAISPGEYYGVPSVEVYDMTTCTKVSSWEGSYSDNTLKNYGIDQDPVTGDIYGAFYDEDGYYIELAKVTFDGAKMTRTETIGKLNRYSVWYGLAFDKEGQLWGISGETYDLAYLYKIDKTTGAMTKVGSTGFYPTANTDACFDLETNTLYWSVAAESGYYDAGFLTTVNLTTGNATKIYEYPNAEVVGGMVIPRNSTAAGAPGECSNVKALFENGNLTGNITLTTPSTTQDGKPGAGTLTINVKAADETVATQEAEWGATVTVPVTMAVPGMYNFTVYASNDEGEGKAIVLNNIFVGPDAPKATTATLVYEDGMMNLTWTPVTESVNGGWLDIDNLTYKVTRFPDETVVAEDLTVTEFSEDLAEPEACTQFCYEVVAVCGENQSAPARSNVVALGSIVPAYTSDFKTNGLEGFTVIDANDDRNKWELYTEDDATEVRVKYNSNMDMDDWLITPAIKLEAGKSYKFSVSAHAHSSSYPERLEVKYGRTPDVEGMTNELIPATEITTKLNKKFEGTIVADESGKFYIGFHGVSKADNYYLYISEFTIEAGEKLAVPVAPADLTVTPAADCSTQAEISLTAPSVDVYGTELTELYKVEVYRGSELVKTFDTVGPGEELGFTDYVSENAEFTYSAYAYNSYGKSEPAVATAYIGVRLPGMPTNVRSMRTANVGEVKFVWDPVTVDKDGNAINPALVSYVVGVPEGDGFVAISNVLTETTFTYQFVEQGTQELVQAAIFPLTAAGQGTGIYAPLIPAGTPYDSFHESFALGGADLLWYTDSSGGGRWGFATDNTANVAAPDGDGGMIAMQGSTMDASADLISGIVNLGAFEYPALSFMVYNQSSSDNGYNANIVMASVLADGEDTFTKVYENTIDQIAPSKKWGTVEIDLTPYEGKTVQVMFTVIVKQYTNTLLDNIRIESQEVTYPAPSNLQTDNGVNCVTLTWSAPEFDEGSPVKPDHMLGYKVYRDDEYILENHLETPAHEDFDVEDGKAYAYHVTALYNHGESAPSNKVQHNYTTALDGVATSEAVAFVDGGYIVIANAEGMRVNVATSSGVNIYDGDGAFRTVLPAGKGVYVVTIDRKSFKLIVM